MAFVPIQTYMKWDAVKNDLRHDELQTITPAMQERVAWTAETALENKFIIFITVTSDYADDKLKPINLSSVCSIESWKEFSLLNLVKRLVMSHFCY